MVGFFFYLYLYGAKVWLHVSLPVTLRPNQKPELRACAGYYYKGVVSDLHPHREFK